MVSADLGNHKFIKEATKEKVLLPHKNSISPLLFQLLPLLSERGQPQKQAVLLATFAPMSVTGSGCTSSFRGMIPRFLIRPFHSLQTKQGHPPLIGLKISKRISLCTKLHMESARSVMASLKGNFWHQ